MQLSIDPDAPTSVSEQIVEGVRLEVAGGRLRVRERLMSVRALARVLLVNPNTVAKAYQGLEREGVVQARAGSGVYVAPGAAALCRSASVDAVRAALGAAVDKARSAGLDPASIQGLFERCLDDEEVLRDVI